MHCNVLNICKSFDYLNFSGGVYKAVPNSMQNGSVQFQNWMHMLCTSIKSYHKIVYSFLERKVDFVDLFQRLSRPGTLRSKIKQVDGGPF